MNVDQRILLNINYSINYFLFHSKHSRDDEHNIFIKSAVNIFSYQNIFIVINSCSIKFKLHFKDVQYKCEQKIVTN